MKYRLDIPTKDYKLELSEEEICTVIRLLVDERERLKTGYKQQLFNENLRKKIMYQWGPQR